MSPSVRRHIMRIPFLPKSIFISLLREEDICKKKKLNVEFIWGSYFCFTSMPNLNETAVTRGIQKVMQYWRYNDRLAPLNDYSFGCKHNKNTSKTGISKFANTIKIRPRPEFRNVITFMNTLTTLISNTLNLTFLCVFNLASWKQI